VTKFPRLPQIDKRNQADEESEKSSRDRSFLSQRFSSSQPFLCEAREERKRKEKAKREFHPKESQLFSLGESFFSERASRLPRRAFEIISFSTLPFGFVVSLHLELKDIKTLFFSSHMSRSFGAVGKAKRNSSSSRFHQAYSHEFHNVIILISGVSINYRVK
jgi:hypothetical protein